MTPLAQDQLQGHGAHLTMILPAIAMIGLALGAELRRWQHRTGRRRTTDMTQLMAAAALSVVAGAIHALVCPAHFAESALFGWFFAVSAVAQVAWVGVLFVRSADIWLRLGVAGNVLIVAIWLVSRTTGLPFGPGAGQRQPVGILDGAASLSEVGVAVICGWLLVRARTRYALSSATRPTWRTNALGAPSK